MFQPFQLEYVPDWAHHAVRDSWNYLYETVGGMPVNSFLGEEDRMLLLGIDCPKSGEPMAAVRIIEAVSDDNEQETPPVGVQDDAVAFLDLVQLDALIENLQGLRLRMLLEGDSFDSIAGKD